MESDLHRDGLAALEQGRYVEGIQKLEQASKDDPTNVGYLIDVKSRRLAVVQQLLANADTARAAGRLDEAGDLYGTILQIDAGNGRAQRGIEGVAADRRHSEIVARAQADFERGALDAADAALSVVLAENPGFDGARALRSKIDAAREPASAVPRLRPRDNNPVTLQFRDANTKAVFEVLSRQTGINFVFDKDVSSTSTTTIFVDRVPVEQAIELILGQNQLGRQVLSENMVLIYPNTAQKQKDYQDQIVKAIYLTNADPTQVQNMLKTVLNASTLFIDERAKEIVIRDTPEAVRMAEKLIASIDVPEPEVMMEVEVLEITRSRLQQLGVNYPSSISFAMTSPDGGDFVFNDYDEQNGDTVLATPLSISIDFLKQTGAASLLASPRIRARNKEQAKVLIGSRVPVITNTVTPVSSGPAVVTGSVQYLDVGLTLEVEPTIYLDGDVAMKVNLEVSTIVKEVRVGGTSDADQGTLAYEIGTRNAQTLLRLKDGEMQILAGLIQDRDSQNSSHLPGLGEVPLLGRLFGSKRMQNDKTEIVLSITPHIVRSQPRPSSENTEFYFGTESSKRNAPLGAGAGAGGAGAAAGGDGAGNGVVLGNGAVESGGQAPGSPGAGAAADGVPNDGAPQAAADAPSPASRGAPGDTPQAAPPPARGAMTGPVVSWLAPGQTGVGQDFDVAVKLSGGEAMRNVRAQLRYDPRVLILQSAEPGDAIPVDLRATALPRVNQIAGTVQFVVDAATEQPIAGDGNLMLLHFKATTPNPASRISLQLAAVGANGATLPPTVQPALTIVVAP
jgi:general secretion pathway protein D